MSFDINKNCTDELLIFFLCLKFSCYYLGCLAQWLGLVATQCWKRATSAPELNALLDAALRLTISAAQTTCTAHLLLLTALLSPRLQNLQRWQLESVASVLTAQLDAAQSVPGQSAAHVQKIVPTATVLKMLLTVLLSQLQRNL